MRNSLSELNKQIEEENELYLKEYGEKYKVSGDFRGIYTICDVHRMIYRMLIDEPDKLSNADKQEELKYYLQRAYTIAKKTDAKLRQYKHNYDDKWYEQLNGFGKQGWESYAVIKDGNTTNFYLKRPIKKTQ